MLLENSSLQLIFVKLDLGKAFRASDLVTTETLAGYAIILFISRKELLNNLLKGAHRLHNQLTDLPAADVIVQSGDFTLGGSEKEAIEFMQWFCDLPYKHKVFVAGNHDMCMYGADKVEGLPENVHYLCNSGVVIGGIKFYGMPMFMEYAMDNFVR